MNQSKLDKLEIKCRALEDIIENLLLDERFDNAQEL